MVFAITLRERISGVKCKLYKAQFAQIGPFVDGPGTQEMSCPKFLEILSDLFSTYRKYSERNFPYSDDTAQSGVEKQCGTGYVVLSLSRLLMFLHSLPLTHCAASQEYVIHRITCQMELVPSEEHHNFYLLLLPKAQSFQ